MIEDKVITCDREEMSTTRVDEEVCNAEPQQASQVPRILVEYVSTSEISASIVEEEVIEWNDDPVRTVTVSAEEIPTCIVMPETVLSKRNVVNDSESKQNVDAGINNGAFEDNETDIKVRLLLLVLLLLLLLLLLLGGGG